jgi:hypothetical protein
LVPPEHGSPSTKQPPEPVVASVPHVPAVAPLWMLQTPVQQSPAWKQMSPVARQLDRPPAGVHFPPLHSCEQHCVLSVQLLPSVVQVAPATAAQCEALQLLVQQSLFWVQLVLMDAQAVAPHLPLVQSRLQQSVGTLQAMPVWAQLPPAAMHVFDTASHDIEQHWPELVQASPLAPQESIPPSGSV